MGSSRESEVQCQGAHIPLKTKQAFANIHLQRVRSKRIDTRFSLPAAPLMPTFHIHRIWPFADNMHQTSEICEIPVT